MVNVSDNGTHIGSSADAGSSDGKQKKSILKEIAKIREYMDDGETVLEYSRQMRFVPGGSPVTPNSIFATDRKIIIRNPTMWGLRENVEYFHYSDIINIKHEKGHFSSTLVITAPGMGTSARPPKAGAPWGRTEDGMIDGIPREDAFKILKIVMSRTKKIE